MASSATPSSTSSRRADKDEQVPTRVLIAEDEAIIRLDLRETLEEEGYEITAETGYKAVSFVAIDDHWTALRFKRV